ncbi:MAG: type II toxin-antitoxin system PemK/MazF family toxin [Bryobacteraceae bacterium]
MEPQQGDIFWVDIPQAQTEGPEQFGRRPFIVMSRLAVNRTVGTVIVVPLTTFGGHVGDEAAIASQPPHRIVIPASEITKDPCSNSQISPVSVAKTDQTRVIAKTRLQQKLGRLSQTAVIAVGAGLAFVFDIR